MDSTGKPVEGALVRLLSFTRGPRGQVSRSDPVFFGEQTLLHTATDGRFATPIGVPAGLEYQAFVTAAKAPPGRTGRLKTAGGLAAAFADVVLPRIRAVDGFVHDREGKPVEGVTVFQSGDGPMRTRTVTDARGRFRLTGVIAGKAILFAEGRLLLPRSTHRHRGGGAGSDARASSTRPRRRGNRLMALSHIRKS